MRAQIGFDLLKSPSWPSRQCILLVAVFSLVSCGPSWAATTNYYYDATGRLMAGFRTNGGDQAYSYDSADNRVYMDGLYLGPPQSSGLLPYSALFQNQVLTSPDGRFTLVLRPDGNLVLYEGSTTLWSAGTGGHQTAILFNEGNGNLAVLDPYFQVIWQTNTAGYPNANLVLQSDGNLVMYNGSTAIWQSGTGGH